MSPIPCTIVTGPLSVGKTSFISRLLALKAPDERWAVLVNEFGALGIDGALVSGGAAGQPGVVVRELAGGCLCCQAAGVLVPAIAQLLRQARNPARLLIEPSGLGHPAGLLQALQSPHLASAVEVHAVVCLVDVRRAPPPDSSWTPLELDQLDSADVVVGTKCDLAAGPGEVQRFLSWATGELWPPKSKVLLSHSPGGAPTADGGASREELRSDGAQAASAPQLPGADVYREVLARVRLPGAPVLVFRAPHDRARQSSRFRSQQPRGQGAGPGGHGDPGGASPGPPELADAPAVDLPGDPGPEGGVLVVQEPTAGAGPVCYRSGGSGAAAEAWGWLWHRDAVFGLDQLRAALTQLLEDGAFDLGGRVLLRVKGVFRVGAKRWVAVNWAPGGQPPPLELSESAYTRDSRVEVIVALPAAGAPASTLEHVGHLLNACTSAA